MKLTLLEQPDVIAPIEGPTWANIIAKICTALTGQLTLIVEKEGVPYAYITDIPVGVPPAVRRTAKLALDAFR